MSNFLKALKVKGVEIDPSSASSGQVLTYDGTKFAPAAAAGGLSTSSYVAIGRLNGDQSIASNSDTLIAFIDDADPNNWWDPTTKHFTPTIAGYYYITVNVWWGAVASSSNQFNTQIRKNGTTVAIFQNPVNGSTGSGIHQGGSKLVYFNGSTDYIDITVYNGTGSSVVIQVGNSSGQGTNFSIALMTAGKGDKGDTGATGPAGASGATTLDGLTDVTTPTPSTGEFLKWDGSAWVNASLPSSSTSSSGIVQLNNTNTSNSTTQAATANAVRELQIKFLMEVI